MENASDRKRTEFSFRFPTFFLYIPFSFLKMQFFILTLLAIRSGISSYFWWFDMISARLRHNNYIMELLRDISWDLRFQLMSSTYIKSITNIIICSKNNLRSHNRLIVQNIFDFSLAAEPFVLYFSLQIRKDLTL